MIYNDVSLNVTVIDAMFQHLLTVKSQYFEMFYHAQISQLGSLTVNDSQVFYEVGPYFHQEKKMRNLIVLNFIGL